ncbi:M56 family metallopeptidase [Aureivirga sp. CE67]|uniref:M56 family metallopeptidase n=1 Tax=Aureivirga sp. CE67 TaxID=1788983 RepID=UPI0018CAF9D8|nr:M56 family metallopeptidase [Aureivirga sp. CE67]
MIIYILKVNFLLLLFAGIYHIFLRKETFYQINRFFLLGGVLCSFLLPNIFIEKEIEITSLENIEQSPVLENVTQRVTEVPTEVISEIDYSNWISIGVTLISVVLLSLLFWKIILLLKQLKKLKWKESFGIKYLESKNENEAFSFYKYIVVNSENMGKNALKKILVHENIHVREFHTFDVLLIQIIEALFWFNPFLRFYRKGFEETHEFLADEKTIHENSFSSYDYQKLIVQLQIKNNSMITNSFKKESTLKRRVLMLQKGKSTRIQFLKLVLIIPFLLSFMVFAQTKEKQIISGNDSEKYTFILTKDSTDEEIKEFQDLYASFFDKERFLFDNIKRNEKEEITSYDFKTTMKNYDRLVTRSNINSNSRNVINPLKIEIDKDNPDIITSNKGLEVVYDQEKSTVKFNNAENPIWKDDKGNVITEKKASEMLKQENYTVVRDSKNNVFSLKKQKFEHLN